MINDAAHYKTELTEMARKSLENRIEELKAKGWKIPVVDTDSIKVTK